MKEFLDSVIRTPGMLFMSLMVIGFTLNAGVQYVNAPGLEGPSLLAAACLMVGQFAIAVVHQLRRIGQKIPLTLL